MIEADRMSPQEPSCSRILPPSARDFPIICPGASGTISERDSQFESASLHGGVLCKTGSAGAGRLLARERANEDGRATGYPFGAADQGGTQPVPSTKVSPHRIFSL